MADPTYRTLLGDAAWSRLTPAIRGRFSVKPAVDARIIYRGTMQVERSGMGWVFAQAAKLFGRPVVSGRGANVPVDVTLSGHADGGVIWTRRYLFAGRPPITASSIKRFNPRDGLVEYSTGGLGMRLLVTEADGGLHFDSVCHFIQIGTARIPLPHWITPGAVHVEHRDEGHGRFRFRMTVRHPVWGQTFFQDGIFEQETA
jgi:hypothetical protein